MPDESASMSPGKDPLRVVVFTGGAVLEDDCAEFIGRLDAEPEIELASVFCESGRVGLPGVARDLWSRRRWLAPLLLAQRMLRRVLCSALSPAAALARRRRRRGLSGRVHFVPDLHAESVRERIAALEPDLGAVYGGPILKPALFRIPRLGTIGIHHGLLPRYRGKKTTFWAMYHGEERVGVAIQKIGSGLDRGDLLLDATLPTGRLPLPVVSRRLRQLGLDLYVEAVLAVHRGTAAYRPQPSGGAALFRDPAASEILRFWLRYFGRLSRRRAAGGPGT